MKDIFQYTRQGHLQAALEALFPNEKISANIRKEANINDPNTGRLLEVDISLPNFSLSFEFQDPHHYITTWYSKRSLHRILNADTYKIEKVRIEGITLILIPCWWAGDTSSLLSTIRFHRPDLFPLFLPVVEIAVNPPFGLFQGTEIPGVGELMLATFPMDTNFNLSGSLESSWWVGEKYDGIRCCWNHLTSIVYSRSGLEMFFPTKFYFFFPDTDIDAEVWFGRTNFEYSQNFLISSSELIWWELLRLVAFDVPSILSAHLPFENRYSTLASLLSLSNPFIILATRISLSLYASMRDLMATMLENGGEGLIMRKQNSIYEGGRSRLLLKLKASDNDAEAIVVRLDTNSALLQLPNEKTISVEITAEEAIRLQKGDIVTYSFDGYTAEGLPLNPSITRSRVDLTWDDVLESHSSVLSPHVSARPYGYWTSKDTENMRIFFEEFARKSNLDPLNPDVWYNIPRKAFDEIKGGTTIISHFKGYVNALMQIFPEIGLEESKFSSRGLTKHWKNVTSRRIMFDKFAKSENFDPLVASNWYYITADRFLNPTIKGIVANRYAGNFSQALSHVYPELTFNDKHFLRSGHWENPTNRREFFENFARTSSFNPLIPENWFNITPSDILQLKNAQSVLSFHANSLTKALEQLFPEMASKLKYPLDMNFGNRKRFFENFARIRAFDPLVADNWYGISNSLFTAHKGALSVLTHYGLSMSKALQHIFPSIGIDTSKFHNFPKGFWEVNDNRRKYLETFALEQGFDPLIPSNWYNANITSGRKMMTMLSYYNFNPGLALVDLFPSIGLDASRFTKHRAYRPHRKTHT